MLKRPNIDRDAQKILKHYPTPIASAQWTSLGNAGGFSGARLWRSEAIDGQRYCLRAWPIGRMNEERLRLIHEAISRCALPIIPRLVPTSVGETWLQPKEQFWEITTWMSGKADFHAYPSDERLFAAMRALAAIHDRWQPERPVVGPCPAVTRILHALRDWRELVQSGWKPDFRLPIADEIHPRGRRAWNALLGAVIGVEFGLLEWERRPVPLQLSLCDVWHDHVLYEANEVTAVIDFGALKPDCVAMDLARLLGSMIPDERERMNRALAVYSACRKVPRDVIDLVPALDRVGFVIGLSNWLRWIYLEQRPFSDAAQISRRMDLLLKRIEAKGRTDFVI